VTAGGGTARNSHPAPGAHPAPSSHPAPGARRVGAGRIRVICNPRAGEKAGLPTNLAGPDQIREAMSAAGLDVELIASESEDDAIRLAREAVEAGYDVVAAAGGDGTVGAVAAQLIGTDVSLGVVPTGSLMNIARSLGIPRDVGEAARIIAGGRVRVMDVGEANGTLFFEVASVGLSAEIFGEAQRVDEGEAGGVVGALRALMEFRPREVRLELASGEAIVTRALLVAIANGPYSGFGFTLAPDAELDDGMFDIAVFRRFSRQELLRHFASIALGRRRYSPKVETYRSERVRVNSPHPLPARADATDLGTTPMECTVRPHALKVLVPPPESAAAASRR
jgi:diacylglycerol kinase (ATP)